MLQLRKKKKKSVPSCRLVLTGLYKPSVAKVSRQQSLQYFGLSCQTGAASVTVKVKLKCFSIGRLGPTSLFARQSDGLKGRLNCLKISGWSLDFWTLSLYLWCAGIFIWIRLTASRRALIYKDTNKLEWFHLRAVADIDSQDIDLAAQQLHFN